VLATARTGIGPGLESVVGRQNHDAADEVGHIIGGAEIARDTHMQWFTAGELCLDQNNGGQPTKHINAPSGTCHREVRS